MREDLRSSISSEDETIFIEVTKILNCNVVFAVVYRPPDKNGIAFSEELENCLEIISKEKKKCYLAGDFNFDLNVHNYVTNYLVNKMCPYGFYSTIHKSTRVSAEKSCLIDNICTYSPHEHIKSSVFTADISDHFLVFLISKIASFIVKKNPYYKHDTRPQNIDRLRAQLLHSDWQNVLYCENAQIAYTSFIETISNAFTRCCPLRKVKHRINVCRSPWISACVLKSIHRKNSLDTRWKENPTQYRKDRYTRYRNVLTSVIRTAKRNHYCRLIEEYKNNSSQIWKIINSVSGSNQTQSLCKEFKSEGDNRLITDDAEIVNGFNKYFSSVAEFIRQVTTYKTSSNA